MSIKVRYFASLSERTGKSESQTSFEAGMRVSDVWRKDTDGSVPPSNLLAAVNMDYADFDTAVSDGDEVAFFPPVTGGSVEDQD